MSLPSLASTKSCDWPDCREPLLVQAFSRGRAPHNARWCRRHRKTARNRAVSEGRKRRNRVLQGTRTCSGCGRADAEVGWPNNRPTGPRCCTCERKKDRNGLCERCGKPRSSHGGVKGCFDCFPGVRLADQERARSRRRTG